MLTRHFKLCPNIPANISKAFLGPDGASFILDVVDQHKKNTGTKIENLEKLIKKLI
jgi:hypothetical protein